MLLHYRNIVLTNSSHHLSPIPNNITGSFTRACTTTSVEETMFTCTGERWGRWALMQAATLGSSAVTRSLVSSAARGTRSTSSPRRRSRAAARPLLRWKQRKRGEASTGRPRTASGLGFLPAGIREVGDDEGAADAGGRRRRRGGGCGGGDGGRQRRRRRVGDAQLGRPPEERLHRRRPP